MPARSRASLPGVSVCTSAEMGVLAPAPRVAAKLLRDHVACHPRFGKVQSPCGAGGSGLGDAPGVTEGRAGQHRRDPGVSSLCSGARGPAAVRGGVRVGPRDGSPEKQSSRRPASTCCRSKDDRHARHRTERSTRTGARLVHPRSFSCQFHRAWPTAWENAFLPEQLTIKTQQRDSRR